MSKNIDETKLIGGKRKNGHKLDCLCHICENMKNKAKRGGYKDELEKHKERMMSGSKKKNGHRLECKCPICKNMNNSKKNGSSLSKKKSRKKRGGDLEEENMEMDSLNNGEVNIEEDIVEKMGGRKKKGNGHKPTCKCPICKNMRKSKKGGQEPDLENQLGDIEEAGIKSTENYPVDGLKSESETNASSEDYNELESVEKGEAGVNIVGGKTRKRRRGKKQYRKTRKMRRNRKQVK